MLKNVHIWKINPIASRNQSAPDGVEYTTDYILFLGSHTMQVAIQCTLPLRSIPILIACRVALSSNPISLMPRSIVCWNTDHNLLSNAHKLARIKHVLFERDSKNGRIRWSRFFTHNRQIRDVCDKHVILV
jgi:hypothetical protein